DALGVEAQAVEQPIDRDVPEQLPMLGVYIMMPEADNARRSINTKQGQRRAMREGRYIYNPPVGYEGVPGADGKQRLAIDDEQAPLIRRAFEQAARAPWRSLQKIWRELKGEGLRKAKSPFYRMLKNPVYAGQLRLGAWRDEPEEIVEGLHEGIITPRLFREVQRTRFEEDKKHARPEANLVEQLPLRGHLVCPECGKRLTGSRSQGRNKYYWYYHCQSPCPARHSAPDANEDFRAWLAQLEIADGVANAYRAVADDLAAGQREQRRREARRAREEKRRLEKKLTRADEMYFEGELEKDSHHRLKRR
ncbi:MAG: hypothetical protein BRD29_03550, partial [Bacteroidetes bacterium QH_2_67_10]